MDIHDKIKEAFKKNRPLKSTWSPEYQPNIYSLDIFLRKAGYRLVDVLIQNVDGVSKPDLVIESVKEGYLYPEITHSVDEDKFYIQIKKYGELPVEDVESLIKGYQKAVDIVHHLETIDLSKLEIDTEDEEE